MNFAALNLNQKLAQIGIGLVVAFAFAVLHHPITGFFMVTGVALGKGWGDYMHGETRQSCLFDLATTTSAGALGILLHLL